ASENVVSEAVLEAQGSILTNKYAEGYPGRRYYGGCQFVDEVETLAIARAKALFGAEAANVQPHSGSQANMCVYFSQLEMGATIPHKTLRGPRGGLILCRQAYEKAINSSVFPGNQGGPLMHVIAAKAVALHEAATPAFRDYQRQIVANAKALAEGLLRRGFRLLSGGTDNHLMMLDLRCTELT